MSSSSRLWDHPLAFTVVLGPLVVASLACSGSDELLHDPSLVVVVERVGVDGTCGATETPVASCWEVVEGSVVSLGPSHDELLARKCSNEQLDPNDSQSYLPLVPGQSEYRVIARFDSVYFDDFPELAVAPVFEGSALEPEEVLEPHEDDAQELVAVGRLPASDAGTLRFAVTGDEEPFPLSEPITLDAPQVELAIESAEEEFASGLGTAVLCVEAPVGFPELATYESTASGVPLQRGTVTMSTRSQGRRWGKVELPIPAAEPGPWLVQAFVGEAHAQTQASLRLPEGLALAGRREVDVAPSSSPRGVTAGEPDSSCRSYRFEVEGADVMTDGGKIHLSTSQGTWVGGTGELDLELQGAHHGDAQLLLPSVITGDVITVAATSAGVPSASTSIDVLPIAAEDGFLFGPLGGPIPVGDEGSAPRILQGRITPPVGASFPSSTTVTLRLIKATPSLTPPVCAEPIDASALTCDPSTGVGAGCALIPPTVSVSPDGWFSVPVAGGLCFAGTLEVHAFADHYQREPGVSYPCLSDIPVETMDSIATVELVF